MHDRELVKDVMDIIAPDGSRQAAIRGLVTPPTILIPDKKVAVAPGYRIEAKLPNDLIAAYEVEDVQFYDRELADLDFYEVTVRPTQRLRPPAHPSGSVVYNVTGTNARINISSTDSSVNVAEINSATLFAKLRAAATDKMPAEDRGRALSAIDSLERANTPQSFAHAYRDFVAVAADHLTVFGPFIPAVTQLLSTYVT